MDAIFTHLRQRYAEIEFPRLWRWATKGGWALLDQGLFSGANFLVNILLARWLPPKEYGAFAVALSIFYLLAGFHTAVLTEPMLVFGAGKYREHFRNYLGMLLWGHWAISALIALGLAGAGWFFLRRGSPLGEALLGLAAAAPFLLLLWMMRRSSYAQMYPQRAIISSGMNLVIILSGLFLLKRFGLLSSLSGFALLGTGGGGASLVLLLCTKPRIAKFASDPLPSMVVEDHCGYGKWALGISLLVWIPEGFAYIWLPIQLGLEGSGIVRAYMNIIAPILQSITAVSLLVLPYFSRLAITQGVDATRKRASLLAKRFTVGVIVLILPIVLFYDDITSIFYGKKYMEYKTLLLIIVLLPISVALNMVWGSLLRAIEKIDAVFFSYVVTGIVSVLTSVILISLWGVYGAALSMVLARFSTSATLFLFSYKVPNVMVKQ